MDSCLEITRIFLREGLCLEIEVFSGTGGIDGKWTLNFLFLPHSVDFISISLFFRKGFRNRTSVFDVFDSLAFV